MVLKNVRVRLVVGNPDFVLLTPIAHIVDFTAHHSRGFSGKKAKSSRGKVPNALFPPSEVNLLLLHVVRSFTGKAKTHLASIMHRV